MYIKHKPTTTRYNIGEKWIHKKKEKPKNKRFLFQAQNHVFRWLYVFDFLWTFYLILKIRKLKRKCVRSKKIKMKSFQIFFFLLNDIQWGGVFVSKW